MAAIALTQEQAMDLFQWLPNSVRAQASLLGLQGSEGLGRYVRAACELAAEAGLAVTADGQLHTGQIGADPEESARHAAALTDPAVAKALEKALSAQLSREQRQRAVALAVYAAGYELQVAVEPRLGPT